MSRPSELYVRPLSAEEQEWIRRLSDHTNHVVLKSRIRLVMPSREKTLRLDKLRERKGVEQVPVILMSATPPQNVQDRTDLVFLEKPFEMNALLILIRQLTDR